MIIIPDYDNIKNVDLSSVPLITGFTIVLEDTNLFGKHMTFEDKEKNLIASFNWWDDVDVKIKNMSRIPLGDIDDPFNDLEQGWQILIFELNSEVYILQSHEPCGEEFPYYCKVKSKEYRKEWTRIIEECNSTSTSFDDLQKALDNPQQVKKLLLREFKQFPEEITDLPHLEELDICFSPIKEIPSSIRKMKALKKLDASHCELQSIAEEIKNCNNLEYINISCNEFTSFPEEISEIESLKTLVINDNLIKPFGIAETLGNIKNLEYCEMTSNESPSLPQSIGSCLKLNRLVVSGNHFTEIPLSIGQCSELENLSISDNYISGIPKTIASLYKLEVFNISNNVVKEIPVEIKELKNIKQLYLSGNRKLIDNIPQWLLDMNISHLVLPQRGDMTWDSIEEEELYYQAYWDDYQGDHYNAAIKKLTKAIDLNNENPMNFYLRGRCYLESCRHSEAVKDFNRAINLGYEKEEIEDLLEKDE